MRPGHGFGAIPGNDNQCVVALGASGQFGVHNRLGGRTFAIPGVATPVLDKLNNVLKAGGYGPARLAQKLQHCSRVNQRGTKKAKALAGIEAIEGYIYVA